MDHAIQQNLGTYIMPCNKSSTLLHRGFLHKVSKAVISVPLDTPDFCWSCIETVSVFQFCAKLQLEINRLNKGLSTFFHTTALNSITALQHYSITA